MKQSEITVGAEYATGYSRNYDSGWVRARVTGPAEKVKVFNRSTYGTRLEAQFPVDYLAPDGSVKNSTTLPARQIHEPWAEYAERKQAAHIRAQEAANSRAAGQRRRAAEALTLVDALAEVGIEADRAFLSKVEAEFLEARGFKIERTENGLGGSAYLIAPYASAIERFVFKGERISVPYADLIRFVSAEVLRGKL